MINTDNSDNLYKLSVHHLSLKANFMNKVVSVVCGKFDKDIDLNRWIGNLPF